MPTVTTRWRRSTGPGRSTRTAFVGLLTVLLVLVAAPLAMVLWRAVTPDGAVDLVAPVTTLMAGGSTRVIGNTVLLGALVCVVSTVFAAPLAFLMARTELRRHRWIDIAVIVPFMTPPYIASMAWIIFIRPRGYLEQGIGAFMVAPLQEVFFSPLGMATVMSFNLFGFLYLLLRNTLDRIGAAPDEAAAVHGGGFMYRLRRVLVPLASSSYSMGLLLVFIKSAGEFGTPITLGNRIGFTVLVSAIYQHTSIYPIDFSAAAALSSVLLSIGIGAWFCQQWFIARRNDTAGNGRVARPATVTLGPWRPVAWAWLGVVLVLSIGVPYLTILASAFTRLESEGLVWSNLTLLNFQLLFDPRSGALTALSTSLGLAIVTATITAAIGIAVALLTVRRSSRVARAVDFLSVSPDTVPAIVVIIGLIFLWNAVWQPVPVYNTIAMLVLAYVVLYIPFSVQSTKAAYQQVGSALLEAAAVSGGSPWFRGRRIVFPLLLPGVLAGWVMVFSIAIRELVGSLILRPPNVHTLATFIHREFEQGNRSLGMALTVLGVFTTTAVLVATESYRARLTDRWRG